MSLAWTERLSIGNAIIDSGHRELISIVNEVEHAFKAGDGRALSLAFMQLSDCASNHFAHEEKVARAVNFPIDKHRRTHQYLQDELQYLRDELEGKCGVWSDGAIEHFTRFLGDWLIEHIIGEDMKLKLVLQTYPYDFMPD